MNTANLDSLFASVNAMIRYAKCDLEPRYNFLIVNVEAGNSITVSARQAKEYVCRIIN